MTRERWEDILKYMKECHDGKKVVYLSSLENHLNQSPMGHSRDTQVTLGAIDYLHRKELCKVENYNANSGTISIEILLAGYKYYDDNLKGKDSDGKIGFK